ncbi:unnamed protein product, partial [Didymodactylos carnosus]
MYALTPTCSNISENEACNVTSDLNKGKIQYVYVNNTTQFELFGEGAANTLISNVSDDLTTSRESTFQLTNEPSLDLQSAVKFLSRQKGMWNMNIKPLCCGLWHRIICVTLVDIKIDLSDFVELVEPNKKSISIIDGHLSDSQMSYKIDNFELPAADLRELLS